MKYLLRFCLLILSVTSACLAGAQNLAYSEPIDQVSMVRRVDLIGKIDNDYLVSVESVGRITIEGYNRRMVRTFRLLDRDLVKGDVKRCFFLPRDNYVWALCYVERKRSVYLEAIKIWSDGRIDPNRIVVDSFIAADRPNRQEFQLIVSENKAFAALIRIQAPSGQSRPLTCRLFSGDWTPVQRMTTVLPYGNGALRNFRVDNSGNILFTETEKGFNSIVKRAVLHQLSNGSTTLQSTTLPTKAPLREVHLEIDNERQNAWLASLFLTPGNETATGLWLQNWKIGADRPFFTKAAIVDNQDTLAMRGVSDQRSGSAISLQLNQLKILPDGGLLVHTEPNYRLKPTSSRAPFGPNYERQVVRTTNEVVSVPGGNGISMNWNERSSPVPFTRTSRPTEEWLTGDISMFAFDSLASLRWTNQITKKQGDETNHTLSFGLLSCSGKWAYIFNDRDGKARSLVLQLSDKAGNFQQTPVRLNVERWYSLFVRQGIEVGKSEWLMTAVRDEKLCLVRFSCE